MVTSPHPAATRAGLEVLRAGGTAIEAAVAAGAVLAVVYPHFCGLGGDAVWMIAEPDGRADCILGIGQATGGAAALPAPLPERGPLAAATSAGVVDSWALALDLSARRHGARAGLAHLLAPAIALAEHGVPLSRSQALWLDRRAPGWTDWPGFAALFDSRALRPERDRFRQPALAASLRALVRDGLRSFYEGALAGRIASGLAAAGAPLTGADLAATRAVRAAPVGMDFAGMHLLAPPPPTQGITTLAILGTLERAGIAATAEGSPDFYHLLVEAVKQAFLDRHHLLPSGSDPAAPSPADLLHEDRLAAMAARIRPDRARPWEFPARNGDTVFLATVDGTGRAVSMLQSLYFDWGSGVVAGDTGILWQNRAAAFNGLPGHPGRIRAGGWPFYTLNPGIGLRDGRPALLHGTQGADGQPQTLATLLVRILVHGMDPAAALDAPRFLLGRSFADTRDSLKLERSAGAEVLAALRRMGHAVAPLPPHDALCGQAGVVAIGADGLTGAHDPRSDGCAMGF